MRNGLMLSLFPALLLATPALAAPPSYGIADIFAEPGLTGYGPESLQWSPDGRHLSYFMRDPKTKLADLYLVDADTGETRLLMSGKDLAGAALPPSAIKNQREQEWVMRYGVSSYHWAPDNRGVYYLSDGQLYLLNLSDRKVTQISREPGAKAYPQVSPDGKWVSYVVDGELRYAPLGSD